MSSDTILAAYDRAMTAYYAVLDGEADGDLAALEQTANDLYIQYDVALMREFDATVDAAPALHGIGL